MADKTFNVLSGDTKKKLMDMGDGTWAEVVAVVAATNDSTGDSFNPDSLPQVLGYTGDNLTTITVTDGVSTWVQTLTYTGSNLTAVSAWVKQ
jgi:hypothetical protein